MDANIVNLFDIDVRKSRDIKFDDFRRTYLLHLEAWTLFDELKDHPQADVSFKANSERMEVVWVIFCQVMTDIVAKHVIPPEN